MTRKNLIELKEGDKVAGVYLLEACQERLTKTGKPFISVTIIDKTARMSGNMWSVPDCAKQFRNGEPVFVDAEVSSYLGQLQLKLNSISIVANMTMEDKKALVPVISFDIDKIYSKLKSEIEEISGDANLCMMAMGVLHDFKNQLMSYPAAKAVHHAEIGGLLLHTQEVVSLVKSIYETMPYFDCSLTMVAALLHDFGKLKEFTLASTGLVADYSREGMLLGHIYMGAEEVEEMCRKYNISKEKTLLLQHMILSHHGKLEFGSPVRPLTMEAYVLHMADELSAKIHIYQDATEGIEPGSFSDKVFALDGAKVYLPAYPSEEKQR